MSEQTYAPAPPMYDHVCRALRNTIGDAIARSAACHKAKTALAFNNREWTYDEIERASNRVAHHLIRLGLHKGERVAAYGKNSDAYVLLWLACAKAGLIHVPVNYALVKQELAYILRQSGARALFYDTDLEVQAKAVLPGTAIEITGALHGTQDTTDILDMARSSASDQPPELNLADTDIVQILYTSGTTSDPKGAMHTHRSLLTEYGAAQYHLDISPNDRCLAALPLYHSAQMHVFMMPMLLTGGYTRLISTPTPDAILGLLASEQLNASFAPPTVWISLLQYRSFDAKKLQHMNKIYYGASIMPGEIVRKLRELLPQAGLYNCYGQSEIAPLATVLRPEEHHDRPTSAGRPLQTVMTRIINPATGEDCPAGEQGELVHRSPQLMTGYWQKPEATDEAFHGGWFHSGDLGYRDEQGYIYIVDRIKDVVNTGGVLVASRDVEEALYQHESVAEVAVIGVPDEKWIEAICAIVVAREGYTEDASALLEHAKATLARFKIPKHIQFVDELPKNSAGKLLKRKLRETFTSADSLA
ncbi:long-chain-fatty-acid--CoA ligase [Marinobacter daepoensis]|uniref:Long-chain-fatty-acid--CoA ligase n=1 Tax=Marinobacter daepoensis TaxID=262077 RepID=A0ABS3BE25_9GAMM|nr:fatty acyl-CoA synthetase [Marinobacter daepoensis]MBN7769783.1 long-chain-fatty-acid--CoA ligase [Marinobacter daepoensis]MBY6078473.1 long-chain-fatty-acid--CoA ligase [Marinobacter daepoensis]